MKNAVFLDRDGVINNDAGHYYITDPKDFTLNPGIIELLTWLKQHNYLLIVISNQGGISRGIFTTHEADRVNSKMSELFIEHGISFDEIYYCPHHPENEKCLCRKPGTVQIEKALSRFNINAKESFFIGDRETDIEAGKNAGLRTILVEINQDMSLVIDIIRKEIRIS